MSIHHWCACFKFSRGKEPGGQEDLKKGEKEPRVRGDKNAQGKRVKEEPRALYRLTVQALSESQERAHCFRMH